MGNKSSNKKEPEFNKSSAIKGILKLPPEERLKSMMDFFNKVTELGQNTVD